MPLHPKAKEFAKSGLFTGVKSFADLEKRIAATAAPLLLLMLYSVFFRLRLFETAAN